MNDPPPCHFTDLLIPELSPLTVLINLFDEDRDNLLKIRENIENKKDRQLSEIVRRLIKNEANK